jgi:chromosomal replication initiation ATPase DnaA
MKHRDYCKSRGIDFDTPVLEIRPIQVAVCKDTQVVAPTQVGSAEAEVTLNQILAECAKLWRLNPAAILSETRIEPVPTARHAAMYVATCAEIPKDAICAYFHRARASLNYGIRHVTDLATFSEHLTAKLRVLKSHFAAPPIGAQATHHD